MGIFAKILKEVLEDHVIDAPLFGGQGPRTDPIWYPLRELAIHSQYISRIKASVIENDNTATLSSIDLEDLISSMQLNFDEQNKLRYALLAQGVQTYLLDRLKRSGGIDSNLQSQVANLAQDVYDILRKNFTNIQEYNDVARDAFELGDNGYLQIKSALSLIDRAHAMAQAAQTAQSPDAIRFWKMLAITAYRELANILEPVDITFSKMFQHWIEQVEKIDH